MTATNSATSSATAETIKQSDNTYPYGVAPQGYRLPAATRLGPVHLQVADVERSLAWYEKVLGLQVAKRTAGSASLTSHGDDKVLVELHQRSGARPVSRRGHLGLYHYAILLPDRAALGRFLAHLAAIGAYAGMSDHFVSEALYLTDPDGLGIEVYADRPRDTWRHEGGQLAMATNPLNVDSVIEAADGERWTGMPKGTVIGHIHLHVADIPKAEAFYHNGLGLDKMVWSYPGALFLSAGGYHHHLGTNTWAGEAPRPEENDAQLLEWTVLVPSAEDAAAAARSLEAGGYTVRPEDESWVVTDPWGTNFRIAAENSK